MIRWALLSFLLLSAALLADRLEDTFYIPLDHPAIDYAHAPQDPVAQLEKRLESGQAKLDYAPNGWGYLPALLRQLGINADSQVLVFSRTSIQTAKISPRTPRAIYFNDDVAVGFVQSGEVLELSSLDPKQGVVFYSLDAEKAERPEFSRRDDCLRCHQGAPTLGVPGIFVSSIRPKSDELRDMHGSAFLTDHRSAFNERWGGWYVTGTHGAQYHLGNNVGLVDPVLSGPAKREGTQNITNLDEMFNTSKYLAASSDLVALMTLEHQTRMTNMMTRIGWDTRIALHDKMDDEARKRIYSEIDEMVTYMLFVDEAPLKEPIAGVSTFTKTFAQHGPRARGERSLRDFDLQKRLFRYPLSYMIYSAAFDGMPDMVRERVYRRLYDVLSDKDQSAAFSRLSTQDRRAVLEIVRETKKNLPAYWSAAQ
jgi:hypothetical protein